MTWRTKLADWISGGELTRANYEAATFEKLWKREYALKANLINSLSGISCNSSTGGDSSVRWFQQKGAQISPKDALRRIAAMETPKANATVRRMAAIAREAVK